MANDDIQQVEDLEPDDGDEIKGGAVSDDLRHGRNQLKKHGVHADPVDRIVDGEQIL